MSKDFIERDSADNFGLDFVLKLKPCSWNWKAPMNDGKTHFGFIAQEVDELASIGDYGFVATREGFFALNYWEFIGPLTKAVQDLHQIAVDQSKRIDELEKKLAAEITIKRT
jgi:hypothetical protein